MVQWISRVIDCGQFLVGGRGGGGGGQKPGNKAVGVLALRLSKGGSSPHCREWVPCKPGGRWVIFHPSPSGVMQQHSVAAPWPFWCSILPCCPATDAEAWCTSCSHPGIVKPTVSHETQSYNPDHYVAPAVLQSNRRSWWVALPLLSKALDWERSRLLATS
jgi:hypothetical protein